MNDQATTLRTMAGGPSYRSPILSGAPLTMAAGSADRRSKTLAVTSGKGGVGKSNLSVNLSLELAALGRSVSLLDADLALANTDVLFGINPQYHLGHVLSGQRSLNDVIVEVEDGVRLIPGGSGVEQLADMVRGEQKRLVEDLRSLEADSDFMIVDTASGIGGNVMGVLVAATQVVVVTTPDPTSVVDAYATIKVLHHHSTDKPVGIVVNDVIGIGDAEAVFNQLRTASARFLNHRIELLGSIPHDPALVEAVREQVPVTKYAPGAPASRAIRLIAKHLVAATGVSPAASAASFWSSLADNRLQDRE